MVFVEMSRSQRKVSKIPTGSHPSRQVLQKLTNLLTSLLQSWSRRANLRSLEFAGRSGVVENGLLLHSDQDTHRPERCGRKDAAGKMRPERCGRKDERDHRGQKTCRKSPQDVLLL